MTAQAAANVGIFATVRDPPLVPDVFLSLDVAANPDLTQKRNRSYFFWEFGKPPDLVIEIVSNREGEEMGRKRRRYARMRIGHYVVWDPLGMVGEATLRAFELRGDLYVAMDAPFFATVGLGLTEWDGNYEGLTGRWLRWCASDGRVVPTGAERARDAEERAGAAEERAAQLAEKLRAMGVDPEAK